MSTDLAPPLPESVAEIAEVIGRDQALRLIGSLPQSGSRAWRVCVYVPKQLPSLDHPLVRILGWHDANKLVNAFSGLILQPSNCRCIVRVARNRRIREMAEEGYSVREIAHGVDLSVDWVREILSGKSTRTKRKRRSK